MPREIKMPKLSDTMEEGTLNVWRKAEGDTIAKGDVLLEIETDKADMEFEAYVSGRLEKILIPAGETVPIGTPIAVVRLERDSDEDVAAFLAARGEASAPAATPAPAAAPEAAPAAPPPSVAAAPPPATVPEAPPPGSAPFDTGAITPTSRLPFFVPDPDRVRATPRARVLAVEKGLDLSEIAGSGPGGAVLAADLERYIEALEVADRESVDGDVLATPVAVRLADDLKVDLAAVTGTGAGGRITKRDVRTHVDGEGRGDTSGDRQLYGDEIKLSQKRKYLIRNMVESKQTAPHFYLSVDVDADPLRALRAGLKEEGRRVTFTHLIMKAAAVALGRHPEVNATYREDRILRYEPVNIAVAVDVGDELLAPVVKNCHALDVDALAAATDALIEKAREKKLSPDDYANGTFTISNLGMLGVDRFYAIITPPQSTVLSVGALRSVPVMEGEKGRVRAGHRMDFGLACDHRVIDGARGARFLQELKGVIESPAVLLGGEAAE